MLIHLQSDQWWRAGLTATVAAAATVALAVVPTNAFAVDGTAAWASSWA